MAVVSFQLGFHSNELNAADLPVEIRRREGGSLVTRAVSSGSVSVPNGSYYAAADLPAGQRILAPFEIMGEQPQQVRLDVSEDERSPHESEELSLYARYGMGTP